MQPETKHSYLDEFRILKTLGSGYHAQVKLGQDPEGHYVAIKKYKKETANLNTLKHQLDIMKILQFQNLEKLIDVREDATYQSRHGTQYKCFAIILEYVSGGELFDYIADTGKFSEKVTRTYFHQIMNGVHYMHRMGYAHRDIKPQNILLSHDFVLKLIDFGFSCLLKGKQNSGILHTKLGTEGYTAPEIPTRNYQGKKIDIFASGVILFIMYAGSPPFQKTTPNDPYYKLIREKDYKMFWSAHSRRRPTNYFSESFKDLFVRMVATDPNERINIQQISKHSWVNEPICTHSVIKQEFAVRQKKLEVAVEKRRQEEEKKKEQRMNAVKDLGRQQHRGQRQVDDPFFEVYVKEIAVTRKLKPIEQVTKEDLVIKEELSYVTSSLKQFFKKVRIPLQEMDEDEMIEEDSIPYLKVSKFEDNDSDKISIKFEYTYGTEDQEIIEAIEVRLTLRSTLDNLLVISFTREFGNQLYFKKITREIRNQFSYCTV